MIIKVKGNAIAVSTANTVSDSTLVRIHATNAATITIAGETNGSFNMTANSVEIVEKLSTDTIAASAAVSCTPISYKA
jgi:hypothetical protein